MIVKALTLVGGLAGAGVLSQFPEFSQQYAQRLGGAIEALSQVVADFDASALAEGLSRDQALTEMTGANFVERRQADMRHTFARHDALLKAKATLDATGPFMRAYHLSKLTDSELMRQTAQIYQPAVPITFAGLTFAAVGFLAGLALASGALSLLRLVFFRRQRS